MTRMVMMQELSHFLAERKMLPGLNEARVTLLHVLPRYRLYGHGAPVTVERHAQDIDEESVAAQVLLQRAAQQPQACGVGQVIKGETALGDPASVILAVADRDDVDLIVLGSQGLNAVERFLIGSVSSKVMAHAHRAVMVVHPPPNGMTVGPMSRQSWDQWPDLRGRSPLLRPGAGHVR